MTDAAGPMPVPGGVSFIVPAHDERLLIGATLDAIHAAARELGESYEIIVADDASTDDTARLAAHHGARVVTVAHRQIAATRNSGARASAGRMLVFVDADTRVNADVVAGALRALRAGAVGGGAGIRFDGVVPLYARLVLPLVLLGFRLRGIAAGCFLFCTREAFDAVGGFDEAYFGAEEIIMSQALRSRGKFVVLKARVLTSGRKLRTHSGRELFGGMLRIALGGRKAVQRRTGLDLWYAKRRHDPHSHDGDGR